MIRVTREWPIGRRLTAMFVIVSASVLLFTSAAFAGFQYWSLRKTERERMMVRAQVMALNATGALAFNDDAAARELLATLRADEHLLAAALYDSDGRLFATYPETVAASLVPDTPEATGYRFERGRLVGVAPVAVEGSLPLGTLYLATDLGVLHESLYRSALIGALLFVLSVAGAWVLARVVQRSISGPILALASAARAVSKQHDYSVRVAEGGGGELSELTGAFNHMLARIETQNRELRANEEELRAHADVLERQVAKRTAALEASNAMLVQRAAELEVANAELDAFAYSVSHDLRAPLRTIDGFSQVVLEDYADKLDREGRDTLGRVRAASQRMGALIDSLLRLARISRIPMSPELVDLSALAEGS